MRGKAAQESSLSIGVGITPAHAGKSEKTDWTTTCRRDHPRACGEKSASICNDLQRVGITPAHAGKRASRRNAPSHQEDHPRVCGEKGASKFSSRNHSESPPRMRGKDSVVLVCVVPAGITPAYAGKRLKRSRSTVPPVAIVPLFPSVCNKPVVSNGSPAGRDAPLFLPAENAAPAPAGPAGSCPASRPSQFPLRIMVISPRP